jgi:uncharacterized delta-60 repeat protein
MTRPLLSTSFFGATVLRQARMASVLVFAIVVVSFSPLTNVQAADGELDSTFGIGGMVKTDFGGNFDVISAIAVQADGKIVVAGGTSNNARVPSFALARYNSDGSLDQSFGIGGRVITNTGGLSGAASLALLPDGKILAGGAGDGLGSDFAMARFNNDGGLDASFGSNGVVLTNVGGADTAWNMAVQPDGKILLGGMAGRVGLQASSFAVVRYKKNGKIDSSFGDKGKAIVEFSSGFDQAYAIALQPDGKVVLAGAADLNSDESPFAITRLNSDGSLDSLFGSGGRVTTNFFGNRNQANGVALQSDGKIVVAGWAARSPDGREVLAIARYNSDGSLDATFGSGGMLTNDFSGKGGEARAIELQRDGKIVVAGLAGFARAAEPQVDFAAVRYNGDGSLDSSFGNGGAAITDFLDVIDVASAIAIQPDGKIVIAGSTTDETTRSDFALARYDNAVPLDGCISDDSNGNLFQFNSVTGDYKFTACSSDFVLSGRGTLKVKGCKTTLKDSAPDRTVSVTIKTCKNKASAAIEALSAARGFSISDSNTGDNTCKCR